MCGIAGYLNFSRNYDSTVITAMTDVLSRRGPDAFGNFTDNYVGLGHRRLSIIDVSADANQPMISGNGKFKIVYNGEVYNFKELASELSQNHGVNFKSVSDTEVILEAFAVYGIEFIKKLNGMFSIAIYNSETTELYVFRDRIGIKPLYYYYDERLFAFASELKSIKKHPEVKTGINYKAIQQFLHLGFIPAPYSIYQKICKLEPGKWLKIDKNGLKLNTYWSLSSSLSDFVINNEQEAFQQLKSLTQSAVNYQLVSDVPLGVFLSGGIDSSLVSAIAAQSTSKKLKTFSIGFEENKYDESTYARAIADYLGTDHHEFKVSYRDAINNLTTIIVYFDEPFADSSALPTSMVSKLAGEHVKVALSGDGGDELFLGYGSYVWAKRLNHPLVKAFHKQLSLFFKNSNRNLANYAGYFDALSYKNIQSHLFAQEQKLFSKYEIDKMFNPDYLKENGNLICNNLLFEDSLYKKRHFDSMENQAFFDLHYYLPDDLLTKVDRSSMYHSLEVRVPLLDHRIVEFALNLSPSLKYKNGELKYLLKKLLASYIPSQLFERPKQGFAIPLENWLNNELSYLVDEYLSIETIKRFNLLNVDYIEKLKADFKNGKTYLYNRVWLLIVLHQWMVKNAG